MTMVSSGPISLGGNATTGGLNQSINIELGRSATASINLNEAAVRTLLAVPSGAISLSNAYGKSNRAVVSFAYTSNTANASLNIASLSGYSAGNSDVTVTVNAGVYVYSTSTGTPGLTLTGGTTGDTLTLVNNGFIMGMGGAGINQNNANGLSGGTAISLGFNTTINNTNGSAYIGGGGGSGGMGGGQASGGGAGGGAGGTGGSGTATGGGPGSSGANGSVILVPPYSDVSAGGGAGGRIFPGTGGAGGSGGGYQNFFGRGGGAGGGGATGSTQTSGGAGGSANNAGGTAGGSSGAGGGGGWGASGGNVINGAGIGGAGGKAVALNGRTVTWTSGNTTRVYGAVS